MRKWCIPALVVVVPLGTLSGCGAAPHDDPAFTGPAATAAPPPAASSGEGLVLTQSVEGGVATPRVAGVPAAGEITSSAGAVAAGLAGGGRTCGVAATRADAVAVSFHWSCAGGFGATATFRSSDGRRLTLADVLAGAWPAYLSSVAAAQLVAGGASPAAAARATAATPASFALWDLAPAALQVTFTLPGGPATVSFPAASLGAYLAPGSPLRAAP